MARDGEGWQNGTQFKTYELFTAGISHLIFSDGLCLQVLKPQKGKPWIRGTVIFPELSMEQNKPCVLAPLSFT